MGLTISEIARAFQISEQEINDFMQGRTMSINQYGEQLVSFADVDEIRELFIHQKKLNIG